MAARTLCLIVFLANLNCIWIDSKDRHHLPPGLAKRVCPDSPKGQIDGSVYVTPTRRISEAEYPVFEDDLEFENLETALDRQLKRYRERQMSGEIVFGADRFQLRTIVDSLRLFQSFIRRYKRCIAGGSDKSRPECLAAFQNSIRDRFAVYVPNLEPKDPRYGEPLQTLFTGYYTPLIHAASKPQGNFRNPIYTKPTDEWFSRVGRYAIDFRGVLKDQGLELFYTADRFDLYLLHLEGGGRISYVDANGQAQSTYLSYAGSNGRKWRYLSAQMVELNWIQEPTLKNQREFIEGNPQLEPQIFSYCPSYVYFKTTDHQPVGSDSVPLTDNRSIATDSALYGFKGVLSFVRAKRPRDKETPTEMMPFSRFVLDQDTGGSIKGKARVDFYFGEGEYAQAAANSVKQRGDLYYLMLKP